MMYDRLMVLKNEILLLMILPIFFGVPDFQDPCLTVQMSKCNNV